MVKTLGIGSRGEDVSKAQEELNRALKKLAEEGKISKSDAIPLAVDGKFGEDTAEAVKTFQKAMKLNKVDKLIGSETQAALSGDVKTAKNLLNESSLTVNMDSVGKTFQKYPGSNIAKGTFKNPSPLEKALMEVEGFNERPKNDGLSKYSDFAHGVPSEKFKNYSKDGKPISKAVAFTALQDQIQFKITQLHERGLDKGFNQMSELQQTAFGHFAYNIDVSKYENKTLGKELKDGNIDKVDDYMKAYDIKKCLLKNNPDEYHADTNVVAVWRHQTIGR